jgi:hypothetical protein
MRLIVHSGYDSQLRHIQQRVRQHFKQLPEVQCWICCHEVGLLLRFAICDSYSRLTASVPHKGWTLAPVGSSCSSHCAADGYKCNSNVLLRVIFSQDVSAVASSAGFSCRAINVDFGGASPYVRGTTCYINQLEPSYRSCSEAVTASQRICCCGSNADCPLPILKCAHEEYGKCVSCEKNFRLTDDKLRCCKLTNCDG